MTANDRQTQPELAGRALSLRPIADADRELLYAVYASTRAEELALTDWDEPQKAAFLRMQFDAQHAYYQQNYRGASFDLILVDGVPAGRLYLDRWDDQYRIVDIALLPEYRGRGIGTALLDAVCAAAASQGLPVTIHVEQFNPALRLYQRLGFQAIGQNGVYLLMKRLPVEATYA